jgi:DNA-binding MarR family transcriptional regulator
MIDDFSYCMVSNSRMAARAITRRYDTYLRGHGVTATQFSLLGGIMEMPDCTVTELAEARGFDRTTLTRNLDRLEVLELVASRPAAHGNGRICELTPKGRALISELLPQWREAQHDLRETLSGQGFDAAIGTLKQLAAL